MVDDEVELLLDSTEDVVVVRTDEVEERVGEAISIISTSHMRLKVKYLTS